MVIQPQIKKVKIVYFSGTGGTAIVAKTLEQEIIRRSIPVSMSGITADNFPSLGDDSFLILVFAVHAFNAPEVVYKWIDGLKVRDILHAAVISVSAGGEMTPNKACRLSSINRLEKNKCKVLYEKMIVMPSNWVVKTPDDLAIMLLAILPTKIKSIVDDLLSGVECRTDPSLIDRIFSRLGEQEKKGARGFGEKIIVNEKCNGCGLCERDCPANNISMDSCRPVFNGMCYLCLNCFYVCPNKALEPGTFKIFVLKDGYDLKAIRKRSEEIEPEPVEELTKGYLWKGVRDYLLEE